MTQVAAAPQRGAIFDPQMTARIAQIDPLDLFAREDARRRRRIHRVTDPAADAARPVRPGAAGAPRRLWRDSTCI